MSYTQPGNRFEKDLEGTPTPASLYSAWPVFSVARPILPGEASRGIVSRRGGGRFSHATVVPGLGFVAPNAIKPEEGKSP